MKVINSSDVIDNILHVPVVNQFSMGGAMRERLSELIWQQSKLSKSFVQIKIVQHKMKLKAGTIPSCWSHRRRSPQMGDLERGCMRRLFLIDILENSASSWAANNVTVP